MKQAVWMIVCAIFTLGCVVYPVATSKETGNRDRIRYSIGLSSSAINNNSRITIESLPEVVYSQTSNDDHPDDHNHNRDHAHRRLKREKDIIIGMPNTGNKSEEIRCNSRSENITEVTIMPYDNQKTGVSRKIYLAIIEILAWLTLSMVAVTVYVLRKYYVERRNWLQMARDRDIVNLATRNPVSRDPAPEEQMDARFSI